MNKPTSATAFHIACVALALLQGVGEFATLQRWRIKEWMAR